jgi:hypothetical protein
MYSIMRNARFILYSTSCFGYLFAVLIQYQIIVSLNLNLDLILFIITNYDFRSTMYEAIILKGAALSSRRPMAERALSTSSLVFSRDASRPTSAG